ncbi:Prokaryotic membrane lipoprotein lipid attachment site [Carpediemonas membranifera]|uniref:Prokaryotic membrane lipoprotein lipid attachment site n=1 Tax=Carpediemonas membranifera TaxID=201153 RepID=A0A8J6AYQ2_9EUKA|nr:Prokaryotic membrane lipoprotein lipid attachment site [Carpediemonas membranifera]|eukprot:KAG9391698.1 Prokaryotic membrane lipoprotein lipid attachment site [Carpediemonas membranifera]
MQKSVVFVLAILFACATCSLVPTKVGTTSMASPDGYYLPILMNGDDAMIPICVGNWFSEEPYPIKLDIYTNTGNNWALSQTLGSSTTSTMAIAISSKNLIAMSSDIDNEHPVAIDYARDSSNKLIENQRIPMDDVTDDALGAFHADQFVLVSGAGKVSEMLRGSSGKFVTGVAGNVPIPNAPIAVDILDQDMITIDTNGTITVAVKQSGTWKTSQRLSYPANFAADRSTSTSGGFGKIVYSAQDQGEGIYPSWIIFERDGTQLKQTKLAMTASQFTGMSVDSIPALSPRIIDDNTIELAGSYMYEGASSGMLKVTLTKSGSQWAVKSVDHIGYGASAYILGAAVDNSGGVIYCNAAADYSSFSLYRVD